VKPSVELRFRCPGEPYWIDRATHLARLAAGFAPCRTCASRHETGGLIQLVDAGDDRTGSPAASAATDPSPWTAEGLAGTALNQIDVALARRFAMAVGTVLSEELGTGGPPCVAVGGDGRWLTAALVAAVSQGCQLAGCRVVEIGQATAGCLALVIERRQLDGGILVANAPSAPETVSLKCWGHEGRPWSVGGQLERVRQAMTNDAIRSSRRCGGLERDDPSGEYRDRLADLFHGLRPLRWVLDTSCRPLVEHLDALVGHSACQILSPGVPIGQPQSAGRHQPMSRQGVKRPSFRARRLDRLRAQVAQAQADFGLWIDGDGDTLMLVDEQGRRLGPERLLWGIWRRAATPGQTVVLANDCLGGRQLFESAGARVVEVEATREAVDAALRQTEAAAAAGPDGRLWLAGRSSTSDALATVGWLLQLLSGQDRPISELLA
jgi:phosphomannomutase